MPRKEGEGMGDGTDGSVSVIRECVWGWAMGEKEGADGWGECG